MEKTVLLGCDFSSSPSKRKPIVLAWGYVQSGRVRLDELESLATLGAFSDRMSQGHWIGGFDLPFGLPRELVSALGWPDEWESCIRHYANLSRSDIRAAFAAFCNARPDGAKFAHRATDRPARSSPSMKWVNPPVAYMLHAGVPRLLDAKVHFPGIQAPAAETPRVALEAYPGLLAREVLGNRSYKSDDRAKQTPERFIARKDLLNALELGQNRLNLRLMLSHAQRDLLADDASGDSLDATLCLMQAAWAAQQHAGGNNRYGLPVHMDSLEGWIVTA